MHPNVNCLQLSTQQDMFCIFLFKKELFCRDATLVHAIRAFHRSSVAVVTVDKVMSTVAMETNLVLLHDRVQDLRVPLRFWKVKVISAWSSKWVALNTGLFSLPFYLVSSSWTKPLLLIPPWASISIVASNIWWSWTLYSSFSAHVKTLKFKITNWA